MKNFNFYNPTRIIFGKNSIAKLGELLGDYNNILIIYGGGSIKQNGVYDQVVNALEGKNVFEFSGIEPNPSYEKSLESFEIIKENNIDFLLAVGGGSVIDATKFISAGYHYAKDPWHILESGGVEIGKTIDFGTVLTLPATGSEMNKGSVITHKEKELKRSFHSEKTFPVFSILDPETTYTLPQKQVINGIVDTFVHVIEQYLTYPVNNQISDRFSESIMITLVEESRKVVEDPNNYDTRANLMWAATMGLNGLIACGVPEDWSTHLIGHELTAFCDIDHGITLSIVLPGVMRVMKEEKSLKILQMGERVFGISSGSDAERIEKTIEEVEGFFTRLGSPTRLSEVGVGQDIIDRIVDRFEERGWKLGENRSITHVEIRNVLESRL